MKTILHLLVTVSISILISSNSIYAYTVEFGGSTFAEAGVSSWAGVEWSNMEVESSFTIRGGTTGEPIDVRLRVDFVQQVNAYAPDRYYAYDDAGAWNDLHLWLPYEFVEFDEEPSWDYRLQMSTDDPSPMYWRHITMELENVGGAYLYPDTEYWYSMSSSSHAYGSVWGSTDGYGMAYGWVGITEIWVNGQSIWKDTESIPTLILAPGTIERFAADLGLTDSSGDFGVDFDGDNDVDGSDLALLCSAPILEE